MKYVKSIALVDPSQCVGDGICEPICPTAAIRIFEKKAVVDGLLCRACGKCADICRKNAIILVPREEPLMVEVDAASVDEEKIQELCRKAHLFPDQPICACTLTPAREAAAAVLLGARTPEELSALTGVRTGCGIYCMGAIQRLLCAHGVELTPPVNNRWHLLPLSVWDIPEKVEKRHPGYYIKEDKKLYG